MIINHEEKKAEKSQSDITEKFAENDIPNNQTKSENLTKNQRRNLKKKKLKKKKQAAKKADLEKDQISESGYEQSEQKEGKTKKIPLHLDEMSEQIEKESITTKAKDSTKIHFDKYFFYYNFQFKKIKYYL